MSTKELQDFIFSLPQQIMKIEPADTRQAIMAGIRYERMNPCDETILRVIGLYHDAIDNGNEVSQIDYIKEHWNDDTANK